MNFKRNLLNAFILSASISIILIVFLTIAGELYSPLKDWLKATFYHHWIGKGILSFATFIILGVLGGLTIRVSSQTAERLLILLIVVSAVSALAIFGFFAYETLLVSH